MLFLSTTEIVGVDIDVNDANKAFVAASAIIPVWAFKHWHYLNLRNVILYPHSFNELNLRICPSHRSSLGYMALLISFKSSHSTVVIGIYTKTHSDRMKRNLCATILAWTKLI